MNIRNSRILSLASASLLASQLPAQDTTKTFFTRRDLYVAFGTVAASAAVSVFDKRIAHWTQTPSVQGSQARNDVVRSLTWVNEMPLTLGAVATWGIGRLTHSKTTTEVGLHASEAMIMTVALSEAIRIPVGRKRPRESQEDQYNFQFGKGLTDFAYRSYPSLHAAAAFAMASAVAGELSEHESPSRVWVTPLVYGVALVPGITRLYLNQHWASDIVSGAVLGQLIGSRVVHYSHTHAPNRVERFFLGVDAVPAPGGAGLNIGLHFSTH